MEGSRTPSPKDKGFVGQVVKDPKDPPRVIFLCGFAGASSEEGHTRLYSDVRLSAYLEIPDEAILHRQDLSGAAAPLGGALLWIEAGAQLISRPAGEPRSAADFLEGDLARACPAFGTSCSQPPPDGSSSNGEAGGQQGDREMGNFCSTNFPNCQTAPQAAPVMTFPPTACVPHTWILTCGGQGGGYAPAQAAMPPTYQCAAPQAYEATPTLLACPTWICPPTLFCPTTVGCLPPTLPPLCAAGAAAAPQASPAPVQAAAAPLATLPLTCFPPTFFGCGHQAAQPFPTFSPAGCILPTHQSCPQPAAAPHAGPTAGCQAHPAANANLSLWSLLTLGCPGRMSPTLPFGSC